jgi:hypothetical protein
MTRYVVTPADGSGSVTFRWDHSEVTIPAGTVLEIGVTVLLKYVIGLENLTELSGAALTSERTGSGGAVTSNAQGGG